MNKKIYPILVKAKNFPTRKLLQGSLQLVVATGVSFLLIPTLSCDTFFMCRESFLQSFLALVKQFFCNDFYNFFKVLRTCICFMYGFIYGLGNDLFPPEVRSQSIGITEIFSALGGMIAPFIILVAETNGFSPLFLFGILGFVALISSNSLPHDQLTDLEEKEHEYFEMVQSA